MCFTENSSKIQMIKIVIFCFFHSNSIREALGAKPYLIVATSHFLSKIIYKLITSVWNCCPLVKQILD